MQIAVDGPAGAGKSTIAKQIARQLNILYLDTGAMYRAITFGVYEAKIDFKNEEAISEFAQNACIRFDGEKVLLNGRDVTKEIRLPEISAHTSDVAGIRKVRQILVSKQQAIAADCSVIMDGRDIGSVVLPNADFKFYLDASIEERAARRYKELTEKGESSQSIEQIQKAIATRDEQDKKRKEGPLICTEDAIVVDTTGKDIQTVIDILLNVIQKG